MLELPDSGLYRTVEPYPGHEQEFPAGVLVYVGHSRNGGGQFIVRPGQNRKNRWFWGEPTTPLRSVSWAKTLKKLPSEGFYTLPEELNFEGGGRWLKNAIVQLGYNAEGRGIIFIAEWQQDGENNVLSFSDRGRMVNDSLLERLVWAPILPVRDSPNGDDSA